MENVQNQLYKLEDIKNYNLRIRKIVDIQNDKQNGEYRIWSSQEHIYIYIYIPVRGGGRDKTKHDQI